MFATSRRTGGTAKRARHWAVCPGDGCKLFQVTPAVLYCFVARFNCMVWALACGSSQVMIIVIAVCKISSVSLKYDSNALHIKLTLPVLYTAHIEHIAHWLRVASAAVEADFPSHLAAAAAAMGACSNGGAVGTIHHGTFWQLVWPGFPLPFTCWRDGARE